MPTAPRRMPVMISGYEGHVGIDNSDLRLWWPDLPATTADAEFDAAAEADATDAAPVDALMAPGTTAS